MDCLESDGWVNWTELATLMAGPYHQVELSVNRLLWLLLGGHDAAGAPEWRAVLGSRHA